MVAGDEDERDLVNLLTDQIEFANGTSPLRRVRSACGPFLSLTWASNPIVILLNKTDLVKPQTLQRLEDLVHHLNPKAVIHRTTRSQVRRAHTVYCGCRYTVSVALTLYRDA